MSRPLGIVFMRLWIPEIDQDPVAHIARDEAREAPYDLGHLAIISAPIRSRRSSGSRRTDNAVEPTRSQNITVSCRRSPPAALATGSEAALLRSAVIAASNLRRCPTRPT